MEERGLENSADQERRAFLNLFGKAAIAAPPAVTMLLATSMSSPAIAASTGGTQDPPREIKVKYFPKHYSPPSIPENIHSGTPRP